MPLTFSLRISQRSCRTGCDDHAPQMHFLTVWRVCNRWKIHSERDMCNHVVDRYSLMREVDQRVSVSSTNRPPCSGLKLVVPGKRAKARSPHDSARQEFQKGISSCGARARYTLLKAWASSFTVLRMFVGSVRVAQVQIRGLDPPQLTEARMNTSRFPLTAMGDAECRSAAIQIGT